MKKLFKARVIKTKKRIEVEELADGRYIDIVTGMIFTKLQIDIVKPRRTIWQTGFHFLRFGFFLHFRQFVHLNSWYLTPGLTFDFINGHDRYFDLEIKFLCFAVGIRFIYVKQIAKK